MSAGAANQVHEEDGAALSSAGRRAGAMQGFAIASAAIMTKSATLLMVPVMPAVTREFADSGHPLLVSMLLTLPSLCVAFLSVPMGFVAGHVSRRRMMMAALLVYGVAGTAPLWAMDFWSVFASRMIAGVADAAILVCCVPLFSDYFSGRTRQKWVANEFAISTVGATSLVFLGGWLADTSWRLAFLGYGFNFLVFALVLFATWEGAAVREKAAEVAAEGTGRLDLRYGAVMALFAVLGSLFYAVMPTQIGFILVSHGISAPSVIGITTAVGTICAPLGSLTSRRVVMLPMAYGLAIAISLMGAGMMLMAFAANFPVLVCGVVLQQFGGGMMLPLAFNHLVVGLPRNIQPRATGLWWGIYFGTQAVTPLVIAGLVGISGDLLLTVAAIGLLSWICAGALMSVSRWRVRGGPILATREGAYR